MSALPAIVHRSFSARDLEILSDRGERFELIQGELVPMSPPGGIHGYTTASLAAHVTIFVETNNLGLTFTAETGFVVERNPDTVLAPDLAFISSQRLPDNIPSSYVPVVPDMILETRSPTDTKKEVAAKVQRWIDLGVRLVWELDPASFQIAVHRPDSPAKVLGIADNIDGEDVLPGFKLPIQRLFRL